jgi:hypothetical protein
VLLNKLLYGYSNKWIPIILDLEANEFFIQASLLAATILFGVNFYNN